MLRLLWFIQNSIGDKELLKMPSAKIIITTTSGFEHLDWRLMTAKGIVPVRMPLLRRDAVVESIIAMLLHANRRQWSFMGMLNTISGLETD